MKNINLIKRLLTTYANCTETSAFADKVALLIQSLPEDDRENAIAIITGDAELTMRPKELIEIICTDKAYTSAEIEFARPNYLQGTVDVRIRYTKMTTCWYRTEEEAARGERGRSYKDEDYVIERPYQITSDTDVKFSLSEWNTGKVVWKR